MSNKMSKLLFLDQFLSGEELEIEDHEDLEDLFVLNRTNRTSVSNYWESVVPTYTLSEFHSHFRLSSTNVEILTRLLILTKLIPHIHLHGRPPVNPEKQVLITLWFLGNQECFRTLSDRFDVTQSTVFRSTRRVFDALGSLHKDLIRWPEDRRLLETTAQFKKLKGFPGVIGAIDSTHISIPCPSEHGISYLNRKKGYSIILQAVCDADMAFTDIYVGWPGSVHDARVFQNSLIGIQLSNKIPNEYHILGDGAYPLSNNLLTPYRDSGNLTDRQITYNFKHSCTRNKIEMAFGRLKGKWRRLKFLEVHNIKDAVKCIFATCILHNFTIQSEDEGNDFDDVDDHSDSAPFFNDNPNASQVGAQKRDLIKNLIS